MNSFRCGYGIERIMTEYKMEAGALLYPFKENVDEIRFTQISVKIS